MKAWFALALLLLALVIAGSIEASPPRSAQPVSAKRAHQQMRMRYLAQGCYPLDYWHVICPEPAP